MTRPSPLRALVLVWFALPAPRAAPAASIVTEWLDVALPAVAVAAP